MICLKSAYLFRALRLFWGTKTSITHYGVPSATWDSECCIKWLANSTYCLLNTWSPTHVALSGTCFLIELPLCSADHYAHISLLVKDDLFDSNHFPISISVDISSPFHSHITYFKWHHICQDFNATLLA